MELATRLAGVRIVPVVEIIDPGQAHVLACTLIDAGLRCIEVVYRTPAATAAIKAIVSSVPDILVAAGTIRHVEQVDDAIGAGAQFLVAPGFNPSVVAYAQERGIEILPGVCTPSEIELALSNGVSVVKWFPAESIGGIRYLSAVSAAYSDVSFVPTGGIGPLSLTGYLAHSQVVACAGSWMVNGNLVAHNKFEDIARLAAEAAALAGIKRHQSCKQSRKATQ